MGVPIVIDVSADGQVQAMNRKEFPLGFLGEQKIVRASDIRFNQKTQRWRIWVNATPECEPGDEDYMYVVSSGEYETYGEAIEFEVLWLTELRMVGITPAHETRTDMAAIALVLRSKKTQ